MSQELRAGLVGDAVPIVSASFTVVAFLDDPVILAMCAVTVAFTAWGSSMRLRDWRRVRGIEAPIEIDARGLVLRTSRLEATVPWEAIASADIKSGIVSVPQLRVRVRPEDDPAAAGAQWVRAGRLGMANPRRYGIRISVRTHDVDQRYLSDLFAYYSAGRVRLAYA